MVFVEFVSEDFPFKGALYYFVGRELNDVMNDTNNGTKFGFATFSSFREISESDARNLNLGFLRKGMDAITRGGPCVSFKLRTPR